MCVFVRACVCVCADMRAFICFCADITNAVVVGDKHKWFKEKLSVIPYSLCDAIARHGNEGVRLKQVSKNLLMTPLSQPTIIK